MQLTTPTAVVIVIAALLFFMAMKYIRIVPQNEAFVVQRLGKYSGTLLSGFHVLIPFFDVVSY
ncbi:MAG: paraslipin, partial [Deltaproteobacteria bacterium]|nr:paraslipin [Deltaproteobacteria bacterium]